ncbi:MAG: phosphoglucosamine mutase, partial [Syntrophomonadaceae bacterium]|nr:phosphoglucosamine mutase [Syntrophomonadaceae bacterium]
GEQSGHLIFLDHATTGDGLLSSLKLVEVMRETGLPLSELAAQMEVFPQILENIELRQRESILEQEPVRAAIARAEERLGEWGKVLVRPSGTEPKIRIMAQGRDEYLLKEVVEDIRTSILAAQR